MTDIIETEFKIDGASPYLKRAIEQLVWESIRGPLAFPTKDKRGHDLYLSLYICCGNRLILNNPLWYTPWVVSIAMHHIVVNLNESLKANKRTAFGFWSQWLAIANRANALSIYKSILAQETYESTKILLVEWKKALRCKKHWIHQSFSAQIFVYKIVHAVQECPNLRILCNARLSGKPAYSFVASDRILCNARLSGKTAYSFISSDIKHMFADRLSYLQQLITQIHECKKYSLHSFIWNRPQSKLIMKQMIELDSTRFNRCGNRLCIHDSYMSYKYQLPIAQIDEFIGRGLSLVRKKKWFICKGCKLYFYCGKRCQKIHWNKQHRLNCQSHIGYWL